MATDYQGKKPGEPVDQTLSDMVRDADEYYGQPRKRFASETILRTKHGLPDTLQFQGRCPPLRLTKCS